MRRQLEAFDEIYLNIRDEESKEFFHIIENSEKLRPYEFLDKKKIIPFDKQKVHKLADFQEELKSKMVEHLEENKNRFLISLPTGGGKTKTAVHFILDHLNKHYKKEKRHILWLAHTEELCEQAYDCFRKTAIDLDIDYIPFLFRYWGDYASDKILDLNKDYPKSPMIIISTPQKTNNILKSEYLDKIKITNFLKKHLMTVFIDEAHRSGANTYIKIIEKLSTKNNVNIIGLTATPVRKEYQKKDPTLGTKNLRKIFKNLILPEKTLGNNLKEIKKSLQEKGYLSQIERVKVDTKMGIQCPKKENQAVDRRLQKETDKDERRLIILEAIKKELEIYPQAKFLYFGATINDVKSMTNLLRSEKYTADYVIGERKKNDRRRIINEFKEGKIQFLCNCEVLTTGFDDPQITHLIMARPTLSQALYQQMIGRGLRGERFGGTKKCRILSCEDIDMDYEKYYDIWGKKHADLENKTAELEEQNINQKAKKIYREENEVEFLDFKKIYIRILLYALYVDGKVLEKELDLLKKNARSDLNEPYSSLRVFIDAHKGSIRSWSGYFFENLDHYAKQLSKSEKKLIFKRIFDLIDCSKNGINETEVNLVQKIKDTFSISKKDFQETLKDHKTVQSYYTKEFNQINKPKEKKMNNSNFACDIKSLFEKIDAIYSQYKDEAERYKHCKIFLEEVEKHCGDDKVCDLELYVSKKDFS